MDQQDINDSQESGNLRLALDSTLVSEGQPEEVLVLQGHLSVIASPGLGLPQHQSGWELARVMPGQKKTLPEQIGIHVGKKAGVRSRP